MAISFAELLSVTRSRSVPYALVRRPKIIVLSAEGLTNKAIGEQIGMSNWMVGEWRKRYLRQDMAGLYDEPRPGGPRSIGDEEIAALIRKTLESAPKNATRWTCRNLAKETDLSKSTVHRVWKAFGLQPHRQKHFQLSTDPFFVEKVRDIVGLYLNPPDKALERTQPMLPMGLGYVEGVSHNYPRHGTTTLFAALDVATGKVIAPCKRRHRHQEFLRFLQHIDDNVPPKLNVHLIDDNYATHKHERVRRWLAARPRYHIHYNPKAQPFAWTATTDSIFQKLERLNKVIQGTTH